MNFPPDFSLLSIEVQKQIVEAQLKVSAYEAQVKISEHDVQRKQMELLMTYKNEPETLKDLLSYISSGS